MGLDPLRCASDTAGSSAADIVRAKNKHDTARFLDTWQPVQEQDESLDTPATPPESPKDHEQEIELPNPSSNTNATKGDEERLLREEISELKSIVKLETAKTKRLRVKCACSFTQHTTTHLLLCLDRLVCIHTVVAGHEYYDSGTIL